jgi:hypothetical protein
LGVNFGLADVLAHEYIHHVQNAAYAPGSGLEFGAIKEAYSDLIAAGIFPAVDGGWDYGVLADGGVVRNILDPTSPRTQSGPWTVDNVSQKSRCDSVLIDCSYAWMGIPSKAAALIATGVPNAVLGSYPLERTRTAKLYFESIRPGSPYRMESLDRLVNQRLKISSLCDEARTDPASPTSMDWREGRIITAADCENIGKAFDAVGVTILARSGFDRFSQKMSGGDWTQTVYQGATLHNGCTLSGHVLTVEISDGFHVNIQVAKSSSDIPPLQMAIKNEVTATVTNRCGSSDVWACKDPTARPVTYRVTSKWVGQPMYVWVDEQLNIPSGKTMSDCLVRQPGHTPVWYWSVPITFTQSAAMFGKREDHDVWPNAAGGVYQTGPCEVIAVGGIDSHASAVPPPSALASTWAHGNHGFSVQYMGTSPYDYETNMHTWVDPFSGIFARVVWQLSKPPGGSCDFKGMARVP